MRALRMIMLGLAGLLGSLALAPLAAEAQPYWYGHHGYYRPPPPRYWAPPPRYYAPPPPPVYYAPPPPVYYAPQPRYYAPPPRYYAPPPPPPGFGFYLR